MRRMLSLSDSGRVAGGPEVLAESELGQAELTISQMSRLYGVSLRTLRFYEDRGLIKPRREGNARFYRAADRVRLEMILQGKKLGFTLTEINDLIGGKGANETPDLEEQLQPHQIVSQIGHLERQRDEIDSAIESARRTAVYRKALLLASLTDRIGSPSDEMSQNRGIRPPAFGARQRRRNEREKNAWGSRIEGLAH